MAPIESTNARQERDLLSIKRDRDALSDQIVRLVGAIAEKKAEISRLQDEADAQVSRLNTAKRETDEEVASRKEILESMRRELEDTYAARKRAMAEVQEAGERLESVNMSVGFARDRFAALEREMDAKEQVGVEKLHSLESQCERASGVLEIVQENVRRTQEVLDALREQKVGLVNELKTVIRESDKASDTVRRAQDMIDGAHAEERKVKRREHDLVIMERRLQPEYQKAFERLMKRS
jgi:chromosome segregation ATPase